MEKMRFETKNITDENIQKILELFPNVTTEAIGEDGKLKTAIDFEKLKQELSDVVIDGEESYDFTWVGKKEAMVEANRPIRKTLRPDRESSVDWENTQNIYIEGDNLEALKLLQESYLGKVKMIYIDPPYNTGKDFVYRDNFIQDKESYDEEIGINDEEGNRLFQNTESNGRFHSDWCSMIYSRLKLARNLLTDDGVIFISIDENETSNLKSICNEIFGEENFIVNFVWEKHKAPKNDNKYVTTNNESILLYAKQKSQISLVKLPRSEENLKSFKNPDNDFRGVWTSGPLLAPTYSVNTVFPIINPHGKECYPPEGKCWAFNQDGINRLIKENRIYFGVDGNNVPRIKRFLSELPDKIGITNILLHDEIGGNQIASNKLKELFDGKKIFDFPKPVSLVKWFIERICKNDKDSIILDFFSGSATTAHAVMQLNMEDSGNRKFIMVQLPEKTDEKSEAYKAGYLNICEIGKERIRRAGKKIKEENPDKNIDIGFRVFKVDDTNMKDVYYTPTELKQGQLGLLESNIKEDRTDEDLLYACLLDWGVELSLPHKVEIIENKRVHIVDEDALIACFEDQVPESVMRKIAEMKPTRVVFKDGSFSGDANKINVEEIFKLISPETTVKVI